MKQLKVLVTGACGYIGRHVVQELLRRGHHVIASDLVNVDLPEGVEFTDYPIFEGNEDVFEKLGKPDALIWHGSTALSIILLPIWKNCPAIQYS